MPTLFNRKEIQKLFGAKSYLETNVSELFFTPKYVYKIKKPVKLEFLDFSDKKERFRITKYEFNVNKKFAPEIYLELVPIKKYKDKIQLNGKGEIMEYAVKMVRFPQSGWLTTLLEQKRVTEALTKKIVETIAKAHSKFYFSRSIAKYGEPKTRLKNLKLIQSLLKKDAVGSFLTNKEWVRICKLLNLIFKKLTPEFKNRVHNKKIQKIHGDLHSENIFVKNRIPYITDAILPIKEWAYGDTAYDLAALAMDFDAYQEKELSEELVRYYSRRRKDHSINRVILFYKMNWAGIRLWVNSLGAKEGKKEAAKKAKRYKKILFEYLDNI